MTRRSCLIGFCGAPMLARAREAESLAATARAAGHLFGCAVRPDQMLADPDFAAMVMRDCAVLVPEIALNWSYLEPRPGMPNYAAMDALVAMARGRGKRLRGHVLLWHLGVPDWARERMSWKLVRGYFRRTILRYRHVVREWKVVNEAIDTGQRMDGLRENIFLSAFGPDYIARAFREARVLAPRARLLINEYGLEYASDQDRRYLFLELLKLLKRDGAPIDGVGLQSHLDLAKGPFDPAVYRRFLDQIAALGLSITITELDVKEYDYVLPAELRDRRAGEAVRAFLDTVLAHPAVRGVVTWGFSDRYSWLGVTDSDRARTPEAWQDGSSPGVNRGLPLDSDLAPTPIYHALADGFRALKRPG